MTDNDTPSWKNTFNSNLVNWGWQDAAVRAARNVGYPYLAWNGRVYDVRHIAEWVEVCLVKDIQ